MPHASCVSATSAAIFLSTSLLSSSLLVRLGAEQLQQHVKANRQAYATAPPYRRS
eukprot:m.165398 g.165398  ORF g.165398 m.165398 type:complete len:55 (-) comp16593_c0_seq3:10-174(-)